MFCPKCGSKIPGHTKFCPFCGEPLDNAGNAGGPAAGGSRPGESVSRQIGAVGSFISNNAFRLLIAAAMTVNVMVLLSAFADNIGPSFSILSGLEKKSAALSALICVLTVFIPVLLSLETVRESFYISAKIKPRDFNVKRHAVSKITLIPLLCNMLACFVLAISPFILYNYRQYDAAASLNIILESYRYPAVICCALCAAAIVLIAISRKRLGQREVF